MLSEGKRRGPLVTFRTGMVALMVLLSTVVSIAAVDGPAQARVNGGSVTEVKVTGQAGVPEDASAVSVNLAAVDPTQAGYLTAYPCGGQRPGTSTVNHDLRHATSNSAIVKVGDGGKICVYSMSGVDVIVDVTGWFPAGADFSAIQPVRVLDTRDGRRRSAGSTFELQVVGGAAGVPAGAGAVSVNLAAVDPAAPGFLTAYPCGESLPTTSTVNHDTRHATSNSSVVKIGSNGRICLYTLSDTDIVVDVTGWFPSGARFTPVQPQRLLDTRDGNRRPAGSTRELVVRGQAGVATNASAVAINLAAVDPAAPGFLTAYPCGQSLPGTSTVNYGLEHATSNSAIVRIGSGGRICLYTMSETDIVVDITGWFPSNAMFTAIQPQRLLDTRTSTTPPGTTNPPGTNPPGTNPPGTNPPGTNPPGSGHFSTLPVGSALPSGAECAARVRPASEIRPENAAANANRGSRANANNRTDWAQFDRVDGDFAGTTDEIIQWAACKWGIDEDIARAQVIKESYWYQSANGDNGESWGLGQVRDTAHQSAFEYSINARTSSAYNLDYTYASWRACFEGVYTWLNSVEHNGTYGSGDVWGCVGVWFSGRWYINNDAYLNQTGDSVRWHYNNKTWLTSTFING